MAPMLAANLAGTLLLKRAVEQARARWRAAPSRWPRRRPRSRSSPGRERHADSPVTSALKRPGYELQRLIGTREPDERQLEVGRAALAEILRVEDRTRVQTP